MYMITSRYYVSYVRGGVEGSKDVSRLFILLRFLLTKFEVQIIFI